MPKPQVNGTVLYSLQAGTITEVSRSNLQLHTNAPAIMTGCRACFAHVQALTIQKVENMKCVALHLLHGIIASDMLGMSYNAQKGQAV